MKASFNLKNKRALFCGLYSTLKAFKNFFKERVAGKSKANIKKIFCCTHGVYVFCILKLILCV